MGRAAAKGDNLKAIIIWVLVALAAMGEPFRVHNGAEMSNIIERIIWRESRGDPRALNTNEYSVGLMGMTRIARTAFNQWTGRDYNYWTMFDATSNREAGSYFLTNIVLRYHCNWNIVQAVASYNCGISNVILGIYPADYCEAVIPWYWHEYLAIYRVTESWRDGGSGPWIVRLRGKDGRPPRIGL